MAQKDLGIVTAYGYAKQNGYTGTEEEFAKLLGVLPNIPLNASAASGTDDANLYAAITALGWQADIVENGEVVTKRALTKLMEAPIVVEYGTSGIWTYRKWSDGVAECWGVKTISGTYGTWGNLYSFDIDFISYPTGLFVESPKHFVSSRCTDSNSISGANSYGGTAANTTGVTHIRPTAIGGTHSFETAYYAVGKWK